MTITQLVDRGLALKAEITTRTKELKDIEQKLTAIGLTRQHESLADEDRDGRRWFAKGSELIVPVVFTADLIIGSFAAASPTHLLIEKAAAGKMNSFYTATRTYKNIVGDGKKFRHEALAQLGPVGAPPFVSACLSRDKDGLPKSAIKVGWEEAGKEGAN